MLRHIPLASLQHAPAAINCHNSSMQPDATPPIVHECSAPAFHPVNHQTKQHRAHRLLDSITCIAGTHTRMRCIKLVQTKNLTMLAAWYPQSCASFFANHSLLLSFEMASASSWGAEGSTCDSSLNPSSPTKQICICVH